MTKFSGTSELTRLGFADRVKELSDQIRAAHRLVPKVPLDDRLIKPAPDQIVDLLNSVSSLLVAEPSFLPRAINFPFFNNVVFRHFIMKVYSRIYGRRRRIDENLLLSLYLIVRDISLLQGAMTQASSELGER